jgi:hypothetical protein
MAPYPAAAPDGDGRLVPALEEAERQIAVYPLLIRRIPGRCTRGMIMVTAVEKSDLK